jgi:hypothetical protein
VAIFSYPSARWGRTVAIITDDDAPVPGIVTGSIGAIGDYFAPNSVDAFWLPPDKYALSARGSWQSLPAIVQSLRGVDRQPTAPGLRLG